MRVALDATSLIDAHTGVARFTNALVGRLAERDDVDLTAFAVTWRGQGRLRSALPRGVRAAQRTAPARLCRAAWLRASVPPVEWLAGSCDIVHGPNFVVPPARRAARVVTIHDLTSVRFPELCTVDTRQYPALIDRAVERGAWVHTVSQFVADEVKGAFSVDADRLVVVPNGLSPPLPDEVGADAATGRYLAGAERYVLALGTVEPRKDLPMLVGAFDEVAATDRDLHLVIAGPDGWGAAALTAARDLAFHRRRIRRLGWVTEHQRVALLRGASVFAYPSRYEGFGIPPLEAMAVGTPVVTTTAGALPEVMGGAAQLIPAGDAQALAVALSAVLTDEDLRDMLIARGHERTSRYHWDDTAEGIVDLYGRAIRER